MSSNSGAVSQLDRTDSAVFALRQSCGLSIEELAARAGISPRTVYNLERTRTTPHRSTRRVLAIVLGCDPDDLVREEALIDPITTPNPAGQPGSEEDGLRAAEDHRET